jgi:hypothetical protein
MTQRVLTRTLAAAAVLATFTLFLATQAQAGGWSYTGRGGRTYSRSYTHYNNAGGNVGRTVTTTRPNGKTATSSFSRSVNNGVITDTHTYTGFNGRTATGTLTRTPGEGGTATHTGRAGNTRSITWN